MTMLQKDRWTDKCMDGWNQKFQYIHKVTNDTFNLNRQLLVAILYASVTLVLTETDLASVKALSCRTSSANSIFVKESST